jgi:hypothetical protein
MDGRPLPSPPLPAFSLSRANVADVLFAWKLVSWKLETSSVFPFSLRHRTMSLLE